MKLKLAVYIVRLLISISLTNIHFIRRGFESIDDL